ncbi:hypothetical protein [Streptomyces yaizuensis]|uniref:Membrane protein n=1 Tax=Streptomyces yaizuensis TaxID=2989713 RepID=A0ABQ5NZP6_9ACTN|nr:hypothetical protein [Streptomyces sp. YSPA8]GLF95831.1 membrane protein [Streptomyces sp. YSPA8]
MASEANADGTGKGTGDGAESGAGGRNGSEPRDGGSDELIRLRERVTALEARPRHHRVRSFFSALLIVIGCVLAPLGAVASWAADEVGDTDRYVATVAPLASDPDVQDAAANRITNAVMDHIDLQSLLEGVAPTDRPLVTKALGRLGGSLESALRSFVHDKAREVVASDRFKTVWTDANRRAHDAVDKALTGSGGGAVQLTNDTVEIDLAPLVDQLKTRLVDSGLTAAGRIPEVHTHFTVLRSDEIGKAKTWFRLLQLAGSWLPVLAFVLVAAGVLLAVRRRRALVAAALGAAFALAVLGAALIAFRAVYLDRLPAGVSQPAAASVYDALTRFLRDAVRMVITLGVVVALAAWLTGPGRYAVLVRRLWHTGIGAARATADHAGLRTGPVGPWLRGHRRWVVWVLLAAAVLAYLLWSHPTAWVVVGIALVLLAALAIVEFLAADPAAPAAPQAAPDAGPDAGPGRPPRPSGPSNPPRPPGPPGPSHPGDSPERVYPDGGGTPSG